jgi:adenylate cyclase
LNSANEKLDSGMLKSTGTYIFLLLILIHGSIADASVPTTGIISADFKDDTLRVNNTNPKKAIRYGELANQLAIEIDFKKGSAYALKSIGSVYYFLGDYGQTIVYWQKSLNIFKSIKDKLGEANLLSNLGAVYFNQGNEVKALDYHLKSLKVSEQIGNKLRIATSLINIGAVYYLKKATHYKALEYYLRALPLSEEIADSNAIGTASVNLGEIYLENDQDALALHYFKKSLDAYKGSVNIPYSLNSIGKVISKTKDYDRAIYYHEQALSAAEKMDGQLDIVQSLLGLGNTYTLKGNYQKAVANYRRAESIAKDINALYELKSAYQGLAAVYGKMSRFGEAFKYQNLLAVIKDSLYNAETDKRLSGLQYDFDIQKKQSEINLLVKSRALQHLELKRQRFMQNSLLGGLVFVFIIAFILYRNARIKTKTNKLLDKQKLEIEHLLSNILPDEVAKELQRDGHATPRYHEVVSVLFTDFKDFTQMSDVLSPQDLVLELNNYFMAFDDIIEKHGLEKIKTIGDAYMCAGGIPVPDDSHPQRIIEASLEIQEYIKLQNETKIDSGLLPWELRIGIHTGPVVAGVVGRKKYAYDVWGSTVNIASRMESYGESGRVNISSATYELVKEQYRCIHRGKILAKNVGEIDMYFVDSRMIEPAMSVAEELNQSA